MPIEHKSLSSSNMEPVVSRQSCTSCTNDGGDAAPNRSVCKPVANPAGATPSTWGEMCRSGAGATVPRRIMADQHRELPGIPGFFQRIRVLGAAAYCKVHLNIGVWRCVPVAFTDEIGIGKYRGRNSCA